MNLVIVESPAKAKTINKYLGDNYTVLASYGHIRDLPSKNGSVDPDQNFKMEWEVDSFSKKYLKEITDAAKDSSKIILSINRSIFRGQISHMSKACKNNVIITKIFINCFCFCWTFNDYKIHNA